ncbi:hypothetical protein KCU88_g2088, partial [Aureobasidium melanogenum]
MHLFLVRHGETEHNVAGLLAGVSDSRLTNHGVLQTQRLGQYLAAHRNLRFTHIYASDLQRAYMTAEEIQRHQLGQWSLQHSVPEVVKLDLLREQDFGSFELLPWTSKRAQQAFESHPPVSADQNFRPQETSESMATRAQIFLDNFIMPLLATGPDNLLNSTNPMSQDCVAVVSHGLFLSVLWQSLLRKFNAGSVRLGPNIEVGGYLRPLEYLPSWNNTAFLEVTIERPTATAPTDASPLNLTSDTAAPTPNLDGHSMVVHAINGRDHLVDLKRARGGLGSVPYDARQKSLLGFFKPSQGMAP